MDCEIGENGVVLVALQWILQHQQNQHVFQRVHVLFEAVRQ